MTYTVQQAREAGWSEEDAELFTNFMNELDAFVMGMCGLSLNDLPDYDFASAFEAGEYPEQAAEYILEESGFDVSRDF